MSLLTSLVLLQADGNGEAKPAGEEQVSEEPTHTADDETAAKPAPVDGDETATTSEEKNEQKSRCVCVVHNTPLLFWVDLSSSLSPSLYPSLPPPSL